MLPISEFEKGPLVVGLWAGRVAPTAPKQLLFQAHISHSRLIRQQLQLRLPCVQRNTVNT